MHCSEAFLLLKPVCDRIIKKPCKQDLQELALVFNKIARTALVQLQDYVLCPLELNLQRPDVRLENKRYILDCIKDFIDNTEIKDVKKFFHLFSLIFIQLYDKKSNNLVADVSEELKLSVVQCAKKITVKCTDDVVSQIYERNNVPKISQGIFICVQIMQTEKMKTLRVAAIEFIMAISRTDGLEREVDVWRPNVADTIMFIVPGMLSGLHKVAIGDDKQGHSITMMALKAWSKIVVLVLEDIPIHDSVDCKIHFSAKVTEKVDKTKVEHKTVTDKPKRNDPKSVFDAIQSQLRSSEWAKNVLEKVIIMADSFRTLQQHEHLKVRLKLVETCHSILSNCHKHLKNESVVFVEILLNLCDDDSNEVSTASEKSLKEISNMLQEESGISLYEILEENFLNIVNKLPRILRVESDNDKLSALRLLKQYILLLGCDHLPHFMQTSSHLQHTVQALLQVVEMQSSRLSLLEDCSLRDLELNQDAGFQTPWIYFRHFADNNIKEKLEEVLRLLGQNGDLEILCNYFFDLLGTETQYRNEIVFVLNEMMLGGLNKNTDEHLVKNMLDIYFSTGMWHVPVTVTTTLGRSGLFPEGAVNTSQARSNLQLLCLLVDGVGKVATALGEQFCGFLMRCLYRVVERAGSPHEVLSAAGLKTASAIAKAVNQGSDITSLLAANMDYFMVQVSLRLRSLQSDHSVLSVLTVAMQHSNKQMFPHLQNAVSDVLLQSCDTFQIHHTSSFLHVFYIFFLCIKKWFPNNCDKENSSYISSSNSCTVENFLKYLENSRTSRQGNLELNENELPTSSKINSSEDLYNYKDPIILEEEPTDSKPETLLHIKMTVAIVKRCLHLLPGKDKQCRLQAIEALTEGMLVLANDDQLLPMVHQVWSPLVGRLQDGSDPLLLNRSFALLCTLADLAKDFIRARTLKQVWLPLCRFLTDAAEKSRNKDSGSAYRYTQLFKLQLSLLEGLGGLSTHLQLQEKEIYDLLRAALPYLSGRQPRPLQESCVKLFKALAIYDGDAVWLEMIKTQNLINTLMSENKEYVRNIESILEFLSETILKL